VNRSSVWETQIGHQRDWNWRGWQVRYTYLRGDCPTAPPILLLHGFGAAIGHWRKNIPELAKFHPIYALDLIGFGASEKVAAHYGPELWVNQVHDFWQTLINRPVILMGNSIGSQVCMATSATFPEMVQALVMLNLPDGSVLQDALPAAIGARLPDLLRITQPIATLLKQVFTQPLWFNPFFKFIRHPRMIRVWTQKAYATSEPVTAELIEILSQPAYDRHAAIALRWMVTSRAQTPPQMFARVALPKMQLPMLLVWGQQDQMVPPNLAPMMVKLNPRIKLVMLDQVGHCPHDEVPDQVNSLVLSWLQAQECLKESPDASEQAVAIVPATELLAEADCSHAVRS